MSSIDSSRLATAVRACAERTLPHLVAATEPSIVRSLFEGIRADLPAPVLWSVADWMKLAILTVTPRAQVTGANIAAQKLLDAKDPLRIHPDGLAASVPAETQRLREAIARSAVPPQPMLLSAAGEDRMIPAVIAPAGAHASVVFVVDSRQPFEVAPDTLTRLYGLTRAEARFAAALMRGLSVEEAAQGLGTAASTARTHLKRIFLKTDTNRQAQLVSLLLSLPDALLRTS